MGSMDNLQLGPREAAMWEITGDVNFSYPLAEEVFHGTTCLDLAAAHEAFRSEAKKLLAVEGPNAIKFQRTVAQGDVVQLRGWAGRRVLGRLGIPVTMDSTWKDTE